MKNPWIIVGVLAVVLIGGSVWYSTAANERYNEGVSVIAHTKGNPDAPVKLVKYSDFQCPACAAFVPYVDEILAAYGDRLSFEYRHFPLVQIHPQAEPAARAAEAAGQQGKFFQFHDLLFKNQATWANSVGAAAYFADYAEELELDMEEFKRVQRSSILRDHVRAQFSEARELGLTGTPSFTLNGEVMQFSTFEEFRQQIVNAIDPTGSIDLTPLADPLSIEEVTVSDADTAASATPAAPAVQFGI